MATEDRWQKNVFSLPSLLRPFGGMKRREEPLNRNSIKRLYRLSSNEGPGNQWNLSRYRVLYVGGCGKALEWVNINQKPPSSCDKPLLAIYFTCRYLDLI